MKFDLILFAVISLVSTNVLAFASDKRTPEDYRRHQKRAGHSFTLTNKCDKEIQPAIADTKCGYSPRCQDAASYTGKQPEKLAPGKSSKLDVPASWVGRIWAQNGKCGAKGESCSMLEFNLDSGNVYTPQSYDISNIQGFTQSLQVSASGCPTATCKDVNCGCSNAYPIGDMSGCAASGVIDQPVKACGKGDIAFEVVFCP